MNISSGAHGSLVHLLFLKLKTTTTLESGDGASCVLGDAPLSFLFAFLSALFLLLLVNLFSFLVTFRWVIYS